MLADGYHCGVYSIEGDPSSIAAAQKGTGNDVVPFRGDMSNVLANRSKAFTRA
jgi:hypothetical protein